jgi:DNA-binding response OmpR family regulator
LPPQDQEADGPRIIVSHDDPAVLDFITSTLRSVGYHVFQAYDGVSALELALLLPNRLLVVNSRLGALDGPELIQRVRKQLPHVGILHIGADDQQRLPPDVPTLPEPFSADQLLAAVASISA